ANRARRRSDRIKLLCRLLARSRHALVHRTRPLLGLEQTWQFADVRFLGRYWDNSGHDVLRRTCLPLAQSRHSCLHRTCPLLGGKADITIGTCPLSRSLSGVKRTSLFALHMSANDPKRTSSVTFAV